MAAVEMYDYLTTKTADYAGTLSVTPQVTLIEKISKSQAIHKYDSGSVDVVSFSDDNAFFVTLQWPCISESDAGIIFDFYADTAKANAMENTFYWTHVDDHTYVVRFTGPIERGYSAASFGAGRRSVEQLTLRVEGRKADA